VWSKRGSGEEAREGKNNNDTLSVGKKSTNAESAQREKRKEKNKQRR